jgi:hypothetical protein
MTVRGVARVGSIVTLTAFAGAFLGAAGLPQARPAPAGAVAPAVPDQAFLDRYCLRCHTGASAAAGLALADPGLREIGSHADLWEKVVRKLRARAMPPSNVPHPDEAAYDRFITALETELDRFASLRPDPGRTEPFRRLNRTEYRNAVRELTTLDVDVHDLLPPDDAAFGFDNVSVANLSPLLMERYLAAAQKISRLAIGSPVRTPVSRVIVLPPDLTQEGHRDGLPFGTRGGTVTTHVFPVDGEYLFRIRLARNRNENVEGLTEPHQIELTLDGRRLQLFTVAPNRNRFGDYYSDEGVDRHLEIRVPVTGGPHAVGAMFLAKTGALIETERQPYVSHFNADRHPRIQPAVRSISIDGPFNGGGVGETPSRQRIFVCRPASRANEEACAKTILSALVRRAYRRPVTDADLAKPLAFFREAAAQTRAAQSKPADTPAPGEAEAFDSGIEMALRALLASPEFLFRIERDPAGIAAGASYAVSDAALASRLSFFLWSSSPDETLLSLTATRGLSAPASLDREVRRMLADPRAESLATNFAGQWLHLRNLALARPDNRQFPDFDENLRHAFMRETEMLVAEVLTRDRPITELLTANYTFLNERLARHYGIANIYGDHFRKVDLTNHPERIGVLGHGGVLTVTSYATRTSPVLRGKWVLESIIGMPPPPAPPDVPALPETSAGAKPQTMRERMVTHRRNAACASCHQLMDPIGLPLENYDAVGRWRTRDEGQTALDVSGNLPGGPAFDGVAGLRAALVARPDVFATTVTEKLMTFALGRGVDHRDAPAIRAIVRDAAREDYRMSAIVSGIVRSAPFRMRRAAE